MHSVEEGGPLASRGERRGAMSGSVRFDRVSVSDGWLGVHEGASPTGRPPPGAGRVWVPSGCEVGHMNPVTSPAGVVSGRALCVAIDEAGTDDECHEEAPRSRGRVRSGIP